MVLCFLVVLRVLDLHLVQQVLLAPEVLRLLYHLAGPVCPKFPPVQVDRLLPEDQHHEDQVIRQVRCHPAALENLLILQLLDFQENQYPPLVLLDPVCQNHRLPPVDPLVLVVQLHQEVPVVRRHLGLRDLQAILDFHLNLLSPRVPYYLPVLCLQQVLVDRGRQQVQQILEHRRSHSVPRAHDRQLVPVDQENLADPGFPRCLRLLLVLNPLDCHGRPLVQSDLEGLWSPVCPEDLMNLWGPWDQRYHLLQYRP